MGPRNISPKLGTAKRKGPLGKTFFDSGALHNGTVTSKRGKKYIFPHMLSLAFHSNRSKTCLRTCFLRGFFAPDDACLPTVVCQCGHGFYLRTSSRLEFCLPFSVDFPWKRDGCDMRLQTIVC
jgi:hypothetical protein